MAIPFAPDSVFLQRLLRAGDYYRDDIDGLIGPRSRDAIARFEADTAAVRAELGAAHPRSERLIATLLIATQRAARKFLAASAGAGLTAGLSVRLVSGTRTYAEQNALFEKGRTRPGPRVTNARGGQSNHNFGIAWDVGIFTSGGAYIDTLAERGTLSAASVTAEYKKLGPVGRALGLFWGGDWSRPDRPHYQMLDNDELGTVRDKFVNGGRYI